MSKKLGLLRFIAEHPEGVSFTDCQRWACEENGHNFDEMVANRVWDNKAKGMIEKGMVRRYRGYWCDYLLPSGYFYPHGGILGTYCTKGEGRRGLYTLNELGKALVK